MTDDGLRSNITHEDALQKRIALVRGLHPDLKIETVLAFLDADLIVFQASVSTQSAGSASAHAALSIARKDVRATTIEDAERDAIGRALDRLGIDSVGSQSVRDATSRQASPNPGSTPGVVNALRRAAPAISDRPASPASESSRIDAVEPSSEEPTAETIDDGTYADYSWTAFWVWAKGQNISTRGQITSILGHQVDNMTPGAIRLELLEQGYDLKDA